VEEERLEAQRFNQRPEIYSSRSWSDDGQDGTAGEAVTVRVCGVENKMYALLMNAPAAEINGRPCSKPEVYV
jgi:hypothetical protein